jgi:hypothetical protein
MTLFHGSNVGFDKVSLDFAKDRRDFGEAFIQPPLRNRRRTGRKIYADGIKPKQRIFMNLNFQQLT